MLKTCPLCYKTVTQLPQHLTRQCLRYCTQQEKDALVKESKNSLIAIATKGRYIPYDKIPEITTKDDLISFMEDRGFILTEKPTMARIVEDEGASPVQDELPASEQELPNDEEVLPVEEEMSRVIEEEPPITEEEPPVTEEKPPVTEEKPPVTEEEPPVTEEEPPVTEEEPPVTEEEPPVTEEEPPVTEEEPPVTEEEPPVTEEEPPVTEEEPPVTEEEPPITEEEPPVTEEEPPVTEEEPPITEEEPPITEEEPPVTEEEPPVTEEEPPVTEEEPPVTEEEPPVTEEEPPVTEEEPPVTEEEPPVTEEEPPVTEEEPPVTEDYDVYRTVKDEEPSTSTGTSTHPAISNPELVHLPAAEDSTSSETSDNEADQQPETREREENTSQTDEDRPRFPSQNWRAEKRIKMKDAGFYDRHSLSHTILKGFSSYLQNHCKLERYKQNVEDVSRFLYFINNRRVSLNFATEIGKTRLFFKYLQDLGLCNQTVTNYLKHVRRLVHCLLFATGLKNLNEKLFKAMKYFRNVTADIQKTLSKEIAKEVVGKRYLELHKLDKTPQQCREILTVAKPAFLQAIEDVQGGSRNEVHQLEILYYLEALIILKHLQRPGVVRNMTVSEWTERMRHIYQNEQLIIVGDKSHKTAAHQVACFVLTEEEEMWFNVYFEKVRPVLAKQDSPDRFFLSTTGKHIHNISNDLDRYQKNQVARKTCETWAVSHLTEKERYLFSKYLSHSNMTAERNYRERTLGDLCQAYTLVLAAGKASENQPQPSSSRSRREQWRRGANGPGS
ncbi:uncharacterized protein [Phyllobates terribilis]|uniref:uncharacterized protein isoform X2 n=1 Tax=Phyllobates terribilis TaxID=111132 RepID=UPI003CCAF26A